MKELMIYALEVLACGGVLLGAYTILLERRVKSRWCRAYLLITTFLAVIIPLLRIPVWAGEVIEAVATPTAVEAGAWTAEVVAAPTQSLTAEMICATIYAFGVALILGVMIYQMLRIRGLRRQATISHTARFSLVCTPHKIASFSFFRTIYVWDQTPAEEMTAIVAHEMSHITHHHSTERIAMECMKAALWWNPFVWIAARRLTEAEEFEADSDVIESGYDLENYMNTLFKQLFGYSPDIANGLRNSLTKKRFQMMTKSQKSRYSLLRLAATLPALIGLLCAFSFTTRAAVIRMRDGDADKVLISQVILLNGKPVTTAEVYHLDPLSIDTAYTLRMGDIPAQYKGADMVHYINTKGAPRYSKLITISGRVHYPDGKPASGYNIFAGSICIIPSTQSELDRLGAVSDAQGGYTLKAPAKGSLYSGNFFVATMSSYDNEGANSYHRDIEVIYPDSAKWKSRIEADGRITLLPERRLPAPVEADEPFLVAETMPTFQGGDLNTFRQWVQTQLRYPAEALAKGIQGRVVLTFVIEKDGSVSNVKVLQSPDKILSDEAIRILSHSPRWSAGKQRGEPVSVKYTLPVDFRTMKENSTTAGGKEETAKEKNSLDEIIVIGFGPNKK